MSTAGDTGSHVRHVEFEACFNFRDLGGYETRTGGRLRWETLYRSDTLHRLTTADLERFASLGLRTVVDLRSRTEIDDYGRLREGRHGATWHHVPMLDDLRLRPRDPGVPDPLPAGGPPGARYVELLEAFGPAVATTFHLLATDGALPAVFHCTAGKDRTGIVAALILDLCGVPDEAIAADYGLSAPGLRKSMQWIEDHEPQFAALLASVPPDRRRLRTATILEMLEKVRDQWGSTPGLLCDLGVGAAEQEALVARLVER